MKKFALLLIFVLFLLNFASCQTTQPEEPSSVPSRGESLPEGKTSDSSGALKELNFVIPPVDAVFVEYIDLDWQQLDGKANTGGMSPYFYNYTLEGIDGTPNVPEICPKDPEILEMMGKHNTEIMLAHDMTDGDLYDCYDIVRMFGWTKEQFVQADAYLGEEYRCYTDEEVDLIFGDDHEAFKKHFKSYSALYHDGKLYAPYWFAKNPLSVWVERGFEKEELRAYMITTALEFYNKENLHAVYNRLTQYLGEEVIDPSEYSLKESSEEESSAP